MTQILTYPNDLTELLVWIVGRNTHSPGTPPQDFVDYVSQFFAPDAELFYTIGRTGPDTPGDADWVEGFPHRHVDGQGWPPNSITVHVYIQAPPFGGEFAYGGLDESFPYTLLTIEPGTVAIIDGQTWHGVKPITAGLRTVILVTEYLPT